MAVSTTPPGELPSTLTHVRVAPFVVSAVVDGSLVVMDEGMRFFELDEVGCAIWEAMGNGADVDAIARSIVARFDVDAVTARVDVERFVGQLAAENLVVIEEDTSTAAVRSSDDA